MWNIDFYIPGYYINKEKYSLKDCRCRICDGLPEICYKRAVYNRVCPGGQVRRMLDQYSGRGSWKMLQGQTKILGDICRWRVSYLLPTIGIYFVWFYF